VLLFALKTGKERLAEHLLNEGAGIDRANKLGWTPLFLAVQRDDPNMIDILLKKCAHTEVTFGRYTLLRTAYHHGNIEAIELLIKYEADVNVTEKVKGEWNRFGNVWGQ
jgi:ankyrin repeat protein